MPKYRWEHLAMVRTHLRADLRGYVTTFVFRVGGTWTLAGTKTFSFGSSMGRYAEVLALACAHAPAGVEIDEATREIAQWGPRAVRRQIQADPDRQFSAESLVRQARNHRAWLEHRQALKAIEAALVRDPARGEALKLRLELLAESGANRAKLRAAAQEWARACPNDAGARSADYGHGLEADDATLLEPAAEWLRRHPQDLPLALALSAYYFRRSAHAQALAVLEICRPAEGDGAAQAVLREQVDFVRRYAGDGWFRARHHTKLWGLRLLPWALVALFLAAKFSVAWRRWNPPPARPDTVADQRFLKQLREKVAALEREMQDMTGLVSGPFAQLKARADAGDAAAQYTVSFRYLRGEQGAPKDPAEGLRYLELAAAQHYLHAVRDLAEKLDEGDGVPRDAARAVTLFEEAMNLGSPRAARIMGERYRDGNGVPKDLAKAFQCFEKAAAGGYVHAMNLAGWALERGEGVEKDLPRALGYYRQAAEKKDEWAAERLFNLLTGQGKSPEEIEEGLEWMRKGAENGSHQLRLAWLTTVIMGKGIGAEQAARLRGWLVDLADKGDRRAQTARGEMFAHGVQSRGTWRRRWRGMNGRQKMVRPAACGLWPGPKPSVWRVRGTLPPHNHGGSGCPPLAPLPISSRPSTG